MEAGYDYLLWRVHLQRRFVKYTGIFVLLFGAALLATSGAYYGYATKARGAHNGVDIYAAEGSKIFSATAGKVTRAGSIKGYGLTVLIHDADGDKLEFLYGHLSNMAVATGATVEKGQLIGYVGKTAHYDPGGKKANGGDGQFFTDPNERAHLHFEVLENSNHVGRVGGGTKRVRQDPEAWLRGVGMELSEGLPVAKIPRSLTG